MAKQNPGAAGAEDEDQNGSEDAGSKEDNDTELEQGDDANTDDGAEGEADGKGGGEADGEGDEDKGEDGDEEQDQPNPLEERLASLEKLLKKEKDGEGSDGEDGGLDSVLVPNFNSLSAEQQTQFKDFYTKNPIQATINMVNSLAKRLFDRVENIRGEVTRGSVFEDLAADPSGKFKNIGRYKGQINAHLQQFNAKDRSNKELVKMAYWAAVGQDSGKAVRKVADGKESNRKIVNKVRPATPGTKGGKGSSVKLNNAQRQAMNLGIRQGIFKDEADYIRTMKKSPRFKAA